MPKIIRYRLFCDVDFLTDYIHKAIKNTILQDFEAVEDKETPDYIIVHSLSETLKKFIQSYTDKELAEKIKILITTEAVYPDFNLFDYCFSCIDVDLRYRYSPERYSIYAKLPLGIQVLNQELNPPEPYFVQHIPSKGFSSLRELEIFLQGINTESSKKKFCNFLYTHEGSPQRTEIFHVLSQYKRVDALGSYLSNIDIEHDRHAKNWFASSVKQKVPYKFSIAFENISLRGYTTEKIVSSFLAETIPIYWGNPNIAEIYHEDSFINCHAYDSFSEVLDRVREIDSNDALWRDIVKHPKFRPEYIDLVENQKSLAQLFAKIFTEPIIPPSAFFYRCALDRYDLPNPPAIQPVFNSVKEDRWFRFGQYSRKRKLWVLGKIISKKLKIYFLLKPLALFILSKFSKILKK